MPADPRERAYRGPIDVTPEREQAWSRWKDNYIAHCIDGWMQQGAERAECQRAAQAILTDFSTLDAMEWMPLGQALLERVGAYINREERQGDARLSFMNSLRTAETSTVEERVLVTAYQLGITVQQAESLRVEAEATQERDRDGAGRTALYRHFDDAGKLLYVGIAKEPGKRAEQHRYHSKWHRFVADTQVEWFTSRPAAELAERAAINDEGPIFNQTHNRANRAAAIDYLFGALEADRGASNEAAS